MSCGNSIPSDKDVVSALKEYEKIEHKLDVDLFGGLKSSIPVQITYKSIKTIGCTSVNSSEAICSVNVEGTSSAINGMLKKNFSEVEKFRLYRVDGVWRTEEAIKSNNSSNSNQSNSIKPTFNSVYADIDSDAYGLVAGKATQNEADIAARTICQSQKGAINCQKAYGDGLKCVAFAESISTGAAGVGTAGEIELAKSTAIKWCKEDSKNSARDCVVESKRGAMCAK